MTHAELVEEVLQIVREYRGSHAEQAGYVDRKFGNVIDYIRAIHPAECAWHGHIDRVVITQRFSEQVPLTLFILKQLHGQMNKSKAAFLFFFPAAGQTTALPLDIYLERSSASRLIIAVSF